MDAGVGAAMCSYNRVDATFACENAATLGDLKARMGFRGWVMSDWYATHSALPAALAGPAIIEQLGKVAHTSFLGFSHSPAALLAKELVDLLPGGKMERVFFSDDGSTAIECAVRMALQFWRRRRHRVIRVVVWRRHTHRDGHWCDVPSRL